MKQYYIHDGKSQLGPFSIQELKTKSLTSDTPVWYVGLGKWSTIGQVAELKHLAVGSASPHYNYSTEQLSSIAIANGSSSVLQESFGKRIFNRNILIWALALTGSAIIFWLIYQLQQNAGTVNNSQQVLPKENDTDQELLKKKMNYRNNWSNYIGLANLKYAAKANQGNNTFEVYVQNNTSYSIDRVELTINYLKKSGSIIKSETIVVTDVPAYSEKSGLVPEYTNGASVNAKITAIRCTQLNLCFPQADGPTGDPHFCN